MTLTEFERRSQELWSEIPELYKQGVDALVVQPDAARHPELPGVYTLGECLTESYLSEWGGPETTRSVLVLYYGSFRHLAEETDEFDWEGELWETMTHELQHHLESLADEEDLVAFDYAADENFRRREGGPFDPYFFRAAEAIEPGIFRLDDEYFLEWEYGPSDEPPLELRVAWRGEQYRVRRPTELGDVCLLELDGLADPSECVTLVLVRRPGWRALLRGLFHGASPRIQEAVVTVTPASAE